MRELSQEKIKKISGSAASSPAKAISAVHELAAETSVEKMHDALVELSYSEDTRHIVFWPSFLEEIFSVYEQKREAKKIASVANFPQNAYHSLHHLKWPELPQQIRAVFPDKKAVRNYASNGAYVISAVKSILAVGGNEAVDALNSLSIYHPEQAAEGYEKLDAPRVAESIFATYGHNRGGEERMKLNTIGLNLLANLFQKVRGKEFKKLTEQEIRNAAIYLQANILDVKKFAASLATDSEPLMNTGPVKYYIKPPAPEPLKALRHAFMRHAGLRLTTLQTISLLDKMISHHTAQVTGYKHFMREHKIAFPNMDRFEDEPFIFT